MPVVNGVELVREAARAGYAVPAFNTQGGYYDLVRAILETAAEERSPVILMAYEANTEYFGLPWLPHLARYLSQELEVTAGVHLDHGRTPESVIAAVNAGYTSVMIDYSGFPLEDNIAATRRVIEAVSSRGVGVEAEIGRLLTNAETTSVAGDNLVSGLADPSEVRAFLDGCNVDMLAVGIGNAHGFYSGEPNIHLNLLRQIHEVAGDTPLVLHGTTGIPDVVVKECIRAGMAKINYGTLLRSVLIDELSAAMTGGFEHKGHAWRVSRRICEKLKDPVRQVIRLLGSAGKG